MTNKAKLYEIVYFDNKYVALDYNMNEIAQDTNSVTLEVKVRELGFTERFGAKFK